MIIKLLVEGQVEELVKKFPTLQPLYDKGKLENLKPNFVLWIAKQNEPPEDVINLIPVFIQNIKKLPEKDIFKYNSNSLRQTLENLGTSNSQDINKIKKETINLGKFGDWLLVVPHSTESSCFWGKGTQWCTAATKTQNLFLSYVARSDANIILFYLINTKEDSTVNPNAKLSVGFINGRIEFNGHGGVSVNARNKGITEDDLKTILGSNYGSIMDSIYQYSEKTKEHPAKMELSQLVQNPEKFIQYINSLNENVREDFVINALNYKNVHPSILLYFTDEKNINNMNEVSKRQILSDILRSPNCPKEFLISNIEKLKRIINSIVVPKDTYNIIYNIFRNPNLPVEYLIEFVDIGNTKPATSAKSYIRQGIAINPNTPYEYLLKLSKDIDTSVRVCVLDNPKVTKEIVQSLSKDDDYYRVASRAQKMLEKYTQFEYKNIRLK